MTSLKGVHHICLKVKDPKKSAEFYSKICELEIFSSENGAYGLSGGGLDSLWFAAPDNDREAVPFNRRGNIGLDHWAWTVTSLEDLKEIEAHLKNLGVEMEDEGITNDNYGGTAIFCEDPDGMPVEFHLMQEK